MNLQMLFFDMGGTIETFHFTKAHRVERCHLIRKCLQDAKIEVPVSDEMLVEKITQGAVNYTRWNMETCIELPSDQIWSNYYLDGLDIRSEQIEPIGEELAFIYETEFFIREMRPEIPEVFTYIRNLDLKIGIISNTQSTRQVPFSLKKYEIEDFVDVVVLSSQYGRRKPDPSIFYYATRLASKPTSACVYIGDKINRDILGAKRAGFRKAIQIRHKFDNGDLDEGASPDVVITNMMDLLPIIDQMKEEDRNEPQLMVSQEVKAIFFDAGDILYYRPNKGAHLNAFLDGIKLDIHPEFDKEKDRFKELAFSGKIGRHEYYEQVIRLYGITDPELITKGIEAIRQDDYCIEIIEGSSETINELKKRGFILGIITDTAMPFSRKLNWFDEHGFGRVWDSVISSKEIGIRKPSPEIYQEAILQTGVEPEKSVFVGHKCSEIEGAKAVGMKTIALNYDNGTEADYYVKDIRDLLKLPVLKA